MTRPHCRLAMGRFPQQPGPKAGMAERFLSASPQNMNDNILYHALARPRAPHPPFPLVSSASFGSARSRPGREAAKRTLDGEDRSNTMKREGKGGLLPSLPAGINEDDSDPS